LEFLCAEQISACSFGGEPQATPHIGLKREKAERSRTEVAILRGHENRREFCSFIARDAIELNVLSGFEIRKLIRSGSSQNGSGLFDAGYGIAKFLFFFQCCRDQVLQFVIFKYFKPFEIRKGPGLTRI